MRVLDANPSFGIADKTTFVIELHLSRPNDRFIGSPTVAAADEQRPGLALVLREWGRIGCIGFGGPPTHIALLRDLCVRRRGWLAGDDFEDALAACNLLPGPASTQLSIYCAWRLRGAVGAFIGGGPVVLPGPAP